MEINSNILQLSDDEKQELIKLLCNLISEKSENPPGNEKSTAHYIYQFLKKEGIKVELQEVVPNRPNVIAFLKGNKPGKTLLFNGHIDVVPAGDGWSVDPFSAVIKDNRIIGRGAADMKSGVAAMIYAVTILHRRKISFSGEIKLVFNVDEERINLGILAYGKKGIFANYAVIGEPSSLNVCIAHKGVSRYHISTFGTAGHAAKTKNPDNAINKMMQILLGLAKESQRVSHIYHQLLGNASMIVTTINGGTAPNIVPQLCEIEIDRRILPGEEKQHVLEKIKEAIDSELNKQSIPYEIDNYLYIPASDIDEQHELVQKALNTVSNVTKKNKQVAIFDATCEAPFFSVNNNIPTIILGPGSLSQAHVKDEFVEIDEVLSATKIYYHLALELLN